MATAVAAITTTTEVYAEPKPNRTYYCFDYDYISPYTGEIVTGTSSCDDTKPECEEWKEHTLATTPSVVSAGDCYKVKTSNPNNPK